MAQLTYAGQGPHPLSGPVSATLMLLMSLIFALLGIKIWGFRRRLTFDRSSQSASRTAYQPQTQTPPRYAAFESQVNGTDNAVHGVFRQRNSEEFESARPTYSTANNYVTGSVPNLQLASLSSHNHNNDASSISESAKAVSYRSEPQAVRRKRREIRSANYDNYATPPTRQPPLPPETAQPTNVEPNTQLDIPNFDHFAEKYELMSAKPNSPAIGDTQLISKENGRYVKYEQVDDVPELLTPEEEQAGEAFSVAAVVHNAPNNTQRIMEAEVDSIRRNNLSNDPFLSLERTDSAFVVEIIAGTPDTIDETDPVIAPNMFEKLEFPGHVEDVDFARIRSTYEMNEADILDLTPDSPGGQLHVPAPRSPPGFGKSIEEDWENFENLDIVTELPEPNWLVHPTVLDSPQEVNVTSIELENVVQEEYLFHQLELIEPIIEEPLPPPLCDYVEPPAYKPPSVPILPDYESLMNPERSQSNQNIPNYADVSGQEKASETKYVSNIEDIFLELQVNGEAPASSSTLHTEQVNNFDELCDELNIVPSPAVRQPPQPAPRSKPTTLNVRGDATPLTCYEPDELPSSSSSSSDAEPTERGAPPPQPAKRQRANLKVRFDVENLQYYQSAELPSSSESEVDFESTDENEPQSLPQPTQRLITLQPIKPMSNEARDVPRLFGTQVSQEESDDESFGRAIQQHRSMTQALRPASTQLDNGTSYKDRAT